MRYASQFLKTFCLFVVLGSLLVATTAMAQEEPPVQSDTIFTDVFLSPEGVSAVDTEGADW